MWGSQINPTELAAFQAVEMMHLYVDYDTWCSVSSKLSLSFDAMFVLFPFNDFSMEGTIFATVAKLYAWVHWRHLTVL